MEAHPLAWPNGWPRTRSHARKNDRCFHGKNSRLSVARVRNQLLDELHLLGARDIVLSSNVPTRSDGLLHSDPRRLDDPGIAIYFKLRGKQIVMARDGFISVAGNLRSLALAIEALRQLERHGGSLMLERAFEGFRAIAPSDWKKPWREVFGIKTDWNGDLTGLYREKARIRHRDAGGSDTLMAELNVAYQEGSQELGLG
jgi:hypothetical protein